MATTRESITFNYNSTNGDIRAEIERLRTTPNNGFTGRSIAFICETALRAWLTDRLNTIGQPLYITPDPKPYDGSITFSYKVDGKSIKQMVDRLRDNHHITTRGLSLSKICVHALREWLSRH